MVDLASIDLDHPRVEVDASVASGTLDFADIMFDDEGPAAGQAALQDIGSSADGNPIQPVTIDLANSDLGPVDTVVATLNQLDR